MLHVEDDELPPSWGKADSRTQRAKHAGDLAGWHAKQLTAVDGDQSERSWYEKAKNATVGVLRWKNLRMKVKV